MKGGAQFNTQGFDRVIRKNITALAGIKLKVGIQKGATATGGGLIAPYAANNNFGTKTKSGKTKIPSRPFMTYSADRIADWMETAAFYEVVNDVIAGKITAAMAVRRIGSKAVDITKRTIRDSALYKPNAPTTIMRKGHTRQLQDSMSMFRNVKFVRVR
ncbi:hypothetical protein NFK58_12945 [Citrobacter portucalensis]|uniref:hypothetical protein n=1 Tax=Citrobacter portucalensis TaxID=1639133 RepID=UPI002430CC48|nr:hypothetical protein [Citrobacter portucalensis]WFZ22215.1 hypothetical protein NFK58_12945 [Citrobacter portucalensis]